MFHVSIIGRSNVGKTTIFNALIGHRLGLENDSYNTTRDVNEVEIQLDFKHKCIIADTGGNTAIEDEASKHIHEKIKWIIKKTNLVLFVVDARTEPTYYELELVKIVRKSKKPVILVLNKTEGKKQLFINHYLYFFKTNKIIKVSAIHRRGIEEMKTLIIDYKNNFFKKTNIDSVNNLKSEKRIIRVALIGQTNAGKSSLINYLTNYQDTNLVLSSPHTTRDTTIKMFKWKNNNIELIDSAGMFKKSKQLNIVDWLALLKTEQLLKSVDLIILVHDGTKTITHFDKKIIGHIMSVKVPFIICFNKTDIIKSTENILENFKRELNFLPSFNYIFVSAITGKNTNKLMDKVINLYDRLTIMHDQKTLNYLVNTFNFKAQFHNKRKRTRLVSLIQSTKKGNHFTAYFTATRGIHFSIRRQLVNEIKESLQMKDIPIKLIIRKENK